MVRSAALLAVAGLAAGCSADMSRFDDGFYTGSVPKPIPQAGVAGNVDQLNTGSVRPGGLGNAGAASQPMYGQGGGYSQAPVTRTASVERSMLPPPGGAQPAMAAPARMAEPMPVASAEPMTTAPAAPARSAKAGWSDTGNRVALRSGETIDTLADRYGVPAKAILAVNGLRSASDAQPGQEIAIPTYSYGGGASTQIASAATAPNGRTLGAPPSNLRAPGSASAQIPAAPSRTASKGGSVVVESGDSVLGLARRNGVSAAALREANGLTDDNIRIGQKLVLPSGATPAKRVASLETRPTMTDAKPVAEKPAKVQPAPVAKAEPKPYEAPHAAETAAKPAAELKPAKVEAAKVEPAPEPKAAEVAAPPAAPTSTVQEEVETEVASTAPTGTGIDQFRWPVQGRVVKRFGEKAGARRNDGLDISVPRGTPIKAAENGVVIYAGDGLKEFGNTVLVKHANGLVTVYGHADDLKVKRGATVKRGQEIATAGMTGDTETPQVHFEVRKDSAPVDPMKFLK
ncbi:MULTISPECIES: peptidoglycan DD-metalloendopeptidase family protein [unclassified Aureimonas]|uniref:peptidoglycan DD-metalloendopeptidase family protein n=1 Tax=unclassified Aureimonas TaxID=2615206 RepID=UPI0006FB9A9E|nr:MULTISPECIES: peptidoglycan DD-metalloendopeptidase family protein [unclassified Aureimonas]KQT79398.1 hypothetical protein ASG54_10320 [Aureimonas sp. Leaf460]